MKAAPAFVYDSDREMPTCPQAPMIPISRSVINVLTVSRLACGLATFGVGGPEVQPWPASIQPTGECHKFCV